jgi:hypothetical protein
LAEEDMSLGTITIIVSGTVAFTSAAVALAVIVYFLTGGTPICQADNEK